MNRKIFIFTLAVFFTLSVSSWAVQLPTASDAPITTNITVYGSMLFFGDATGNLSAVNNYEQVWSVKFTDSVCIGSPAVQGDKVIFTQRTGEVTCLNTSDGSLVWQYVPPFTESSTEGLNDGAAIGDGRVYAAFTSGTLRALDLESGKELWNYTSEQGLRTAPTYSDGLVLLGEYNGLFSMIDAKTGKRLNGGGAGGAVNTPSVSGGNVYYSAWDGSVHAVQIKNVIPLWSAKVGEPATTPPVISDGIVFVGTASGKITALNQNDGAILWEHSTQGGQLILSVSGGDISAETEDGRKVVLNAKTGKLIITVKDKE